MDVVGRRYYSDSDSQVLQSFRKADITNLQWNDQIMDSRTLIEIPQNLR